MKRFLGGLLISALFFGAIGQTRSDSIYWTEISAGAIRRASLDGTGKQTLVTGQSFPAGIALDADGGSMYWADFGGGDIRRANLDGTGQQMLLKGLSSPAQIALDLVGGKIYWADGNT